jgi:hypothetical protein
MLLGTFLMWVFQKWGGATMLLHIGRLDEFKSEDAVGAPTVISRSGASELEQKQIIAQGSTRSIV